MQVPESSQSHQVQKKSSFLFGDYPIKKCESTSSKAIVDTPSRSEANVGSASQIPSQPKRQNALPPRKVTRSTRSATIAPNTGGIPRFPSNLVATEEEQNGYGWKHSDIGFPQETTHRNVMRISQPRRYSESNVSMHRFEQDYSGGTSPSVQMVSDLLEKSGHGSRASRTSNNASIISSPALSFYGDEFDEGRYEKTLEQHQKEVSVLSLENTDSDALGLQEAHKMDLRSAENIPPPHNAARVLTEDSSDSNDSDSRFSNETFGTIKYRKVVKPAKRHPKPKVELRESGKTTISERSVTLCESERKDVPSPTSNTDDLDFSSIAKIVDVEPWSNFSQSSELSDIGMETSILDETDAAASSSCLEMPARPARAQNRRSSGSKKREEKTSHSKKPHGRRQSKSSKEKPKAKHEETLENNVLPLPETMSQLCQPLSKDAEHEKETTYPRLSPTSPFERPSSIPKSAFELQTPPNDEHSKERRIETFYPNRSMAKSPIPGPVPTPNLEERVSSSNGPPIHKHSKQRMKASLLKTEGMVSTTVLTSKIVKPLSNSGFYTSDSVSDRPEECLLRSRLPKFGDVPQSKPSHRSIEQKKLPESFTVESGSKSFLEKGESMLSPQGLDGSVFLTENREEKDGKFSDFWSKGLERMDSKSWMTVGCAAFIGCLLWLFKNLLSEEPILATKLEEPSIAREFCPTFFPLLMCGFENQNPEPKTDEILCASLIEQQLGYKKCQEPLFSKAEPIPGTMDVVLDSNLQQSYLPWMAIGLISVFFANGIWSYIRSRGIPLRNDSPELEFRQNLPSTFGSPIGLQPNPPRAISSDEQDYNLSDVNTDDLSSDRSDQSSRPVTPRNQSLRTTHYTSGMQERLLHSDGDLQVYDMTDRSDADSAPDSLGTVRSTNTPGMRQTRAATRRQARS